jgi:glycosyltransferase involved in cell wall biosynthesis
MKKMVVENYNINESVVVPLGVGDSSFDQIVVNEIRQQYDLLNKTAFLYIGTMSSSRRLEIVIEAFVQANKDANGGLSLMLLGDAPNQQDVARLIQIAKIASDKNIHFIKRVPRFQVPNYIAACDVGLATIPINQVFLCSSPTKVLEYLNMGVPVLATRIPDQVQILKESNSGLLCDFSVNDIANKMAIFHQCANRKYMGESGRTFIAKTRRYEHIADIVASYYELNFRDRV